MKKGELKIYLFRHGQTTYNRDKRFTGSIDSKLTKKGRKDAIIISKKLKRKKFQVAIQTQLSRSKDTLKEVLKYHPECVLIIEDKRMIERSYGIFQGMSHKNFIKKFGKEKFDKVHRGYKDKVKGGESFYDVEKRVKYFIKDLKKFMIKNNVSVAISAHGNSIRLFRKIMEKAPIKKITSWKIPYDKVFIYSL